VSHGRADRSGGRKIVRPTTIRAVPLPLVPPMQATAGVVPGDPAAWAWEVKWDGWRGLVYLDGGFKVRTRTGREVSASVPELGGLVDALDGRTAILDGDLVACPDGRPDFNAPTPRMAHTGRHARRAATQTPVTFVAFDLLHLDDEDLCAKPLVERKVLLDGLGQVGPGWGANGWYLATATRCSTCAPPTATKALWPSGSTRPTCPAGAPGPS